MTRLACLLDKSILAERKVSYVYLFIWDMLIQMLWMSCIPTHNSLPDNWYPDLQEQTYPPTVLEHWWLHPPLFIWHSLISGKNHVVWCYSLTSPRTGQVKYDVASKIRLIYLNDWFWIKDLILLHLGMFVHQIPDCILLDNNIGSHHQDLQNHENISLLRIHLMLKKCSCTEYLVTTMQ